jgi:hypothetical protein
LARVQILVETIANIAREQASHAEPSIAPLTDSFNELLNDFADEYEALDLDEVVVGALAQVVSLPLPYRHRLIASSFADHSRNLIHLISQVRCS